MPNKLTIANALEGRPIVVLFVSDGAVLFWSQKISWKRKLLMMMITIHYPNRPTNRPSSLSGVADIVVNRSWHFVSSLPSCPQQQEHRITMPTTSWRHILRFPTLCFYPTYAYPLKPWPIPLKFAFSAAQKGVGVYGLLGSMGHLYLYITTRKLIPNFGFYWIAHCSTDKIE